MADTLNAKQRAFVEHYIAHENATQAAIAAGYSKRSARQTGSRMLTRDDVAAEIDAARDAKTERLRETITVTEAMVIRGLLTIALDKATPRNVQRQAWVDLGRHLGMFVQRFSFTKDQLDRAAHRVSDEYGIPGHEDAIVEEAERILKQAEKDVR